MSKVRVALLGTGGIANRHITEFIRHPDVEMVALGDTSEEQVESFCERHFGEAAAKPACYTDAAKMYAEAKPDAVSICTPHTLHYDHAVQAVEAGCHVLMEKPMVTDLGQAVALEKLVAGTNLVFTIGYNTPCSVEFKKIRDIVRSGELGKLKVITMYISQRWYHLTQGKWRQEPELSGGGMAYDSGAHILNSLVWTVEADVAEVHAWVDNLDCPVDINSSINVRFVNGVTAAVGICGEAPNGSHGAWIFENGKIETNPWSAGWIKIQDVNGEIKYPAMEGTDFSPMYNFVESILGRDEPRTSVRNGVQQSQLMDAIYESARTGLPAKPPVVE